MRIASTQKRRHVEIVIDMAVRGRPSVVDALLPLKELPLAQMLGGTQHQKTRQDAQILNEVL